MSPGFRTDLNALRALAVLLVVSVHALGRPDGGWVGVDVFFVLSGFLITRSMLSERLTTGRFGLGAFIGRRLRRLLPASLTTLLVVSVLAVVALRTPLASSILADASAAAIGVVNWVFVARGADYWAAASSTSPVQHFWSLGVELQFYALFPLAVLAVWRTARNADPERLRRITLVTVAVITAASIAWAAWLGSESPGAAYFDTGARFWELAAGSLVGAASVRTRPVTRDVPVPLRVAGVVGGFVLILLASLTAPASGAVPVPDSVVPVVGALLVVASGQGLPPLPVLRTRAVQWVGDASYSIYLWHFPAVLAAALAFPGDRPTAGLVAVVVGVGAGAVSRRWVEIPGMRSPSGDRGRRRPIAMVAAAAVLAVAASSVSGVTGPHRVAPGGAVSAQGHRWDSARLTLALRQGTQAQEWSDVLARSLDAVVSGPPVGYAACDHTDIADAGSCSYGPADADRSVAVVGSSVGVALMPAVRGAFADHARVRGLTASGCPMIGIEVEGKSPEQRRSCQAQREAAVSAIVETRPDVVIVTHAYDGVAQLVGDPTLAEAGRTWERAAEQFVRDIGGSGARVVFLAAVPQGPDPAQCAALRVSSPQSCGADLSEAYRTGAAAERRVASAHDRVEFVDSSTWYCVDGRCPVTAGDVLIRKDGQHLTGEFAVALAPVLRAAVGAVA